MMAFPFLVVGFPVYRCRPVELPLPSGKAIDAHSSTNRCTIADAKVMKKRIAPCTLVGGECMGQFMYVEREAIVETSSSPIASQF